MCFTSMPEKTLPGMSCFKIHEAVHWGWTVWKKNKERSSHMNLDAPLLICCCAIRWLMSQKADAWRCCVILAPLGWAPYEFSPPCVRVHTPASWPLPHNSVMEMYCMSIWPPASIRRLMCIAVHDSSLSCELTWTHTHWMDSFSNNLW